MLTIGATVFSSILCEWFKDYLWLSENIFVIRRFVGYYLKSCGMGNILIEVWKLYEIGEKHLTEVLQS